jgi:hypothetical protein
MAATLWQPHCSCRPPWRLMTEVIAGSQIAVMGHGAQGRVKSLLPMGEGSSPIELNWREAGSF